MSQLLQSCAFQEMSEQPQGAGSWNIALDQAGSSYYWHSESGETTYEQPADFELGKAQFFALEIERERGLADAASENTPWLARVAVGSRASWGQHGASAPERPAGGAGLLSTSAAFVLTARKRRQLRVLFFVAMGIGAIVLLPVMQLSLGAARRHHEAASSEALSGAERSTSTSTVARAEATSTPPAFVASAPAAQETVVPAPTPEPMPKPTPTSTPEPTPSGSGKARGRGRGGGRSKGKGRRGYSYTYSSYGWG